jgi:hypothetical protein
MERLQTGQFKLLILILAIGAVIGVSMGYLIWNPGASNYSVISKSEEATRTAWVGYIQVTYPSVVMCKPGEDASITIEMSNMDDVPELVVVSLSLVRSSGVDSTTISDITGNPYRATLASYGSATNILSFTPSDKGYAIFDLTIRGELAGSITLYIVSSP